jgi:diguanylate cyclase (GGDEF)-like protein/PAS domain S-box-containing protein
MYLCELKIFIMSTDEKRADEIATLLRKTSPPEDCRYEIKQLLFGSPCDAGMDCAVVIDSDIEKLRGYKKNSVERVVFLTSAEGMAVDDAGIFAASDDLWVMQDKNVLRPDLIGILFTKLLADLKRANDARRTEICFNTFIDSLPDLVWFKDNGGSHLIVNNEFCGVVEKTKQQTYKKGHNYIWDVPEEDGGKSEAVCRSSEDVVVKKRKTCQFEERITTKDGMRQLITYKSPLIDADGRIFGTCGMGHDITDLRNVSKELRIIVDCIPFGIAIENTTGELAFVNRFLENLFPGANDFVGKDFTEWNDRIPKEKVIRGPGELAYRISVNGQEYIMRYQEEELIDIFGDNLGKIHLIRDVTMQYNFEQQNLKFANTDFLTGLNNRRSLFDYLTGLGKNSLISLIMLDLDKFKSVNDTYGHAAGDEALTTTSKVMKKCFPDGFIARLGGDEFLVALVGENELSHVERRTQELLDGLLENYLSHEEFKLLSASAGIAQKRLDNCDIKSIESLIKKSDEALYTAKHSGKARYCVWK